MTRFEKAKVRSPLVALRLKAIGEGTAIKVGVAVREKKRMKGQTTCTESGGF